MKQPTDQALAQWMIEMRERGFSGGSFLRKSARSYLLLLSIYAVLLSLLAYLGTWIAFALLLGMLMGCLLRDISWLLRTRRAWPFTEKVTDWDLVRELADRSRPTQP